MRVRASFPEQQIIGRHHGVLWWLRDQRLTGAFTNKNRLIDDRLNLQTRRGPTRFGACGSFVLMALMTPSVILPIFRMSNQRGALAFLRRAVGRGGATVTTCATSRTNTTLPLGGDRRSFISPSTFCGLAFHVDRSNSCRPISLRSSRNIRFFFCRGQSRRNTSDPDSPPFRERIALRPGPPAPAAAFPRMG